MTQELRKLAERLSPDRATVLRIDAEQAGESILSLLDRLEAAEKDAARLDWLQEQSYKAPHLGWVARDSTTGRGYRLHQDDEGAVLVRVAIDKAMEASK